MKIIHVGLYYSEESQKNLLQYCRENGLDLSVGYDGEPMDVIEFHTTLFYGSTNESLCDDEYYIDPIELFPDHFEILGLPSVVLYAPLQGEKGYLCLCFRSPELDDLRRNLGYTIVENHSDYKPHTTLTYKFTHFPPELPDFKLVVDRIKIRVT